MTQTANELGLRDGEVIFRHNGEHTGFGDKPVVYDVTTGSVRVGDDWMDGAELMRLADKVKKARIRGGIDKKPAAGMSFVAGRMEGDALLKMQRDTVWENLPLYYPEPMREMVRERVPEARKVVEDE